ncbi:MAG: hypothetical protein WD851_15195 [Pirellulales bacterium]
MHTYSATLHRNCSGERGMVSFATLVALLFLAVFGALVFNAGQTVTRKIETQNAADAVAYSSSVWVARGMNAVTAANHMMGELTALYVMHHSLGGKWIDEKGRDSTNSKGLDEINTALRVVYEVASKAGSVPLSSTPYKKVKENPSASVDSTIYKAKRNLKLWLAIAYGSYIVGAIIEKIPYGQIPGQAIQWAAVGTSWKIYQEWLVLDGAEILAVNTREFAFTIAGVDKNGNTKKGALDTLYGYEDLMIKGVFLQCQFGPREIAKKHGATGFALGDFPNKFSLQALLDFAPQLPVEKHTHKGRDRSQLMRATYPWVCRWRKPINDFFDVSCFFAFKLAPLFRYDGEERRYRGKWYRMYTNIYSDQAVLWMQLKKNDSYNGFSRYGMGKKGKAFNLYVVKGLNDADRGFDKSTETWNSTENHPDIEHHFTHMGFAAIEEPAIGAAAVYRQENPDGFVCFSHSMVYNANPQQAPAKSGQGGDSQPTVGWDTLNWTANAIEFPMNKDLDSSPKVVLNWQAKLIPVTTRTKLVKAGLTALPTSMGAPLRRSPEILILNNH